MKPGRLAGVLCLVVAVSACWPADRSIFDPRLPVQTRVLPLDIHIMDPNVAPDTWLGVTGQPLLSDARILEARYVIEKDFGRNVFEPGDPKWGHLVVRVDRNAWMNWGWAVPSICTLYVVNLLGFPIGSQTSEVTLDIEILDAQRRQVTQFTAKGTDTEYAALYWGYPWAGFSVFGGSGGYDTPGPQMVQAEALRGALDDAKRQIEGQANQINARLRAAAQAS